MGNRPRTIELHWPAAGLVRRAGYQQSDPYSSLDCSNVRPRDTFETRERGGSRPGTTKAMATLLNAGAAIQLLQPVTVIGTDGTTQDTLAAIAGGSLYKSTGAAFTQVTGTLNTTASTLHAAALGQKLYIADYRSVRRYGSDGTIAGSGTDELSATGVADWTALGISTTLDKILLTGVASDASQDAVYPIASVDTAHIHVTGTLTAGTCSWELGRTIKIYDPSAGTLTALTPTYGIAPLNCRMICSYRERLVVVVENTWYMSAQGDPLDWDYITDDPENPGRAFYSGNEDAGKVPHPITAVIPHSDDYLIFGAEHSLWILKGDPGYGGQVDNLSYEVGIVGPNAWAKTAENDLVFLSRDGVYVVPAGGGVPQPFSRERLPAELLDVDMQANVVSMAYDVRGQGCWLFITPTAGTAGTAWWIDWPTKSFWPISIPAVQQPRCMTPYAADVGDQRHILMGGYDGYVRRFSDTATTDDGTAISSYVEIGPLRMGDTGHDGLLMELAGTLDESSGDVTWSVMSGDTPEAASASTTVKVTGTWGAGRNDRVPVRVRDVACKLKLSSTARWAMEHAFGTFGPGGRIR